jgi:hypothetical protein
VPELPAILDMSDWGDDIGIAVRPPSYPTGGAFWRPGPTVGDLKAPSIKTVFGIPVGVDWGSLAGTEYIIAGAIAVIALAYLWSRR